jgi:RHS repeat-associated protein
MDYFGARYYNHTQYRFNCVDPIIAREDALVDPQSWNLYIYCRNNPLTFRDPYGRDIIPVTLPGIGKAYLDEAVYPLVKSFISNAEEAGMKVEFTSAFRFTSQQEILRKNPNLDAAEISLHEAGFAVDIKMSQFTENKKDLIVKSAEKAGLSWGGKFISRKHPEHYYKEVPGGMEKRTEYREKAQAQAIRLVSMNIMTMIAALAIPGAIGAF